MELASRRALLLFCAFVVAYLLASWLDLWSTTFALSRSPTASEQNVYATTGGAFDNTKVWLTTGIAGLFLATFFAFGLAKARRTSEQWLKKPRQSLLTLSPPPWTREALGYLPIHALAYPAAFVVLRVMAGLNNLLIAFGLVGPLGWAVKMAGKATTPLLGFWIVAALTYLALLILAAPWAARLIVSMRGSDRKSVV